MSDQHRSAEDVGGGRQATESLAGTDPQSDAYPEIVRYAESGKELERGARIGSVNASPSMAATTPSASPVCSPSHPTRG